MGQAERTSGRGSGVKADGLEAHTWRLLHQDDADRTHGEEPARVPDAPRGDRPDMDSWNRARVATAVRAFLARSVRVTIDAILPPQCLSCGERVAEHGGLCGDCWGRVRWIDRPFCEVTGAPMTLDLGEGMLSPHAIAMPPPFERARAAVMFDDLPRRLVHRLKYGDETGLARWMAGWMVRAGAELAAECDAIVPVPLHPGRLLSRRFNQSAELSRFLSRSLELPHHPEWLARVKRTRQQVGLGHGERRRNVQGAFRVPDHARPAVSGRRVLLIDDVLTTGATVSSATRALKRGGARAIDVLTFARVDFGDDGAALVDALAALDVDDA